MNFKKNIKHEELMELPIIAYSGKVVIIDSEESYKKIIPDILNEKIWGFDTETKPCFIKGKGRQPVALLQLTNSKVTYLFRLNKYGLQKEVISLLSDPKSLKIGVSVSDDVIGLQKLKKFKPGGFIELQETVKKHNIEDMSLRKITAIVLGGRISKAQQLSNWAARKLRENQIKYAATDSWVGREIYLKLNENIKKN